MARSESAIFEDTASQCSSATGMVSLSDWGVAEDNSDQGLGPFDSAVEVLYEKRSTTREAGLETLGNMMACNFNNEEVVEKLDVLTTLLVSCVKRGGPIEAINAARCIGLLAITLGSGSQSERLLSQTIQVLVKVAKTGQGAAARTAAVEALSIVAFVAASGDHAVSSEVMTRLEDLRSSAPTVATAALRGWSLLLSPLAGDDLRMVDYDSDGEGGTSDGVARRLADLSKALTSSNVGVRQAAGEGVALLYTVSGFAEERGSAVTSGACSPGEAATTSPTLGASEMDDVMTRMRDLASHKGDDIRRSKRDRSALKTTFRDLVASIEGSGKVASTKIRLANGDSFEVNSLPELVQLNALRRYLAEGFQRHLLSNPFLHEVFGFQPSDSHNYSCGFDSPTVAETAPRIVRSPSSASAKAATQKRGKDRKNSMLRKGMSYSNLGECSEEW